MPTAVVIDGFRFFFFSNEGGEPVHIHVKRGDGEAKYWLEPQLNLAYSIGFKVQEEKEIFRLVTEHQDMFKTKWHEYFSN